MKQTPRTQIEFSYRAYDRALLKWSRFEGKHGWSAWVLIGVEKGK